MPDFGVANRVGLHEGKGWRGDILDTAKFALSGLDKATGKIGFTGTNGALQQNSVARSHDFGETFGGPFRVCGIFQIKASGHV